jgi:hypothetical protein
VACKILITNRLEVKIFKTKEFGCHVPSEQLRMAHIRMNSLLRSRLDVTMGVVEIFEGLLRQAKRGEAANYLYRFKADGDHLADQSEDVLRVVGEVGVVGDAAALVG